MTYNFYRLQIKDGEFGPTGEPVATLHLNSQGEIEWQNPAQDFKALCIPWFDEPTQWDTGDSLRDLEPYSDEALTYLRETKLPSFGFYMQRME